MKWNLVSDSTCDFKPGDITGENITFSMVPLTVTAGGKDFVDLPETSVDEMLAAHKASKLPSTSSCPSPEMWAEKFRQGDATLAFTITGGLSGSYNSALVGRDIVLSEDPDKKIHVVDTRGTAGSLVLGLRRAKMLIESGMSFEEVEREIETYMDGTHLLFSLTCFDNLIRTGRMSRFAGIMAGSLGIHPVAKSNERGEIELVGKPRGELGAIKYIITTMGELKKLEGRPVIVSHCKNEKSAKLLAAMIHDELCTSDITIMEMRILNSYYALPGGLIITF